MHHFLLALLIFCSLSCRGPSVSTPASNGSQAPSPKAELSNPPTPPVSQTETEVAELHLDETATAGGLELRWVELNDSRCPIGVVCIWEGQAAVTLEVSRTGDAQQAPQEVELILRAGTDSTQLVLAHELGLLNVEPHPRDGVTPARADHVATIEVRAQ